VEFTPSSDGDGPVLPELLDQIPEGEKIGTITADGAYDTRRCHTAVIDRQAKQRANDRRADADRLERIETDIRTMCDVMFEAFQRSRTD
jgi:hypothetical protein